MIKNERQYKITKAAAKKFRDSLLVEIELDYDVDPIIALASSHGMSEQLAELNQEIQEYEALKSEKINVVDSYSLDELPKTLIKARIAAGLNHKELGQRLGLKEQQIQRYEESDYSTASFSKLLEIAAALDLTVNHSTLLGVDDSNLSKIYKKLEKIGLEKDFIIKRLSSKITSDVSSASKTICSFLPMLQRVYGWEAMSVLEDLPLTISPSPALSARFKVRKGQNENRLNAYTVYAHYLALLSLESLDEIDPGSLPNTAEEFYDNVVSKYKTVSFETVLGYIWSLGIAVLPLNDRATFDGAYWRVANKHVITISQRVPSSSFWLFDLLHDYFHATQDPESPNNAIIEYPPTSEQRRESQDEIDASEFAGEVVLAGQSENLWNLAYQAANGNLKYLKSKLPEVARSCGVDPAAAANFLAFKLSLDGENWWGTARKFQPEDENPWELARNIFLENMDISNLNPMDKRLLTSALSDEDYENA